MRLNAENLKASEPVNAPTHARESKTGANAKNTPTRVRHLCQNAPARARERPNPDLTRPNSSSTAPCNEAQCHANNLANTKKIPRLPTLERWTSVLGPQSLGHSSYESLLDKQHAQAYLIRARMEN